VPSSGGVTIPELEPKNRLGELKGCFELMGCLEPIGCLEPTDFVMTFAP